MKVHIIFKIKGKLKLEDEDIEKVFADVARKYNDPDLVVSYKDTYPIASKLIGSFTRRYGIPVRETKVDNVDVTITVKDDLKELIIVTEERRHVPMEWRTYICKTKKVEALRLTEENVEQFKGKVDGALIPGNYIIKDGDRMYYESDGTFRHYYCPDDFSDEDKRIWALLPTVVKMKTDTAEEAMSYATEHHLFGGK